MKKLALLFAAVLGTAAPIHADDSTACDDCGACCADAATSGVLANYDKVSTALAADDLAAAQAAAANLACCLKCDGGNELAAKVEAFAKAKSLADARASFKTISAAIIPLVAEDGAHYIMTCPMAGADWVQTTETVANPYYGSEMLRCGSVKKAVKPQA